MEAPGGNSSRPVSGELAECPACNQPAGVPIPLEAEITAGTDDGDGSSPTVCPGCGTEFVVYYAF